MTILLIGFIFSINYSGYNNDTPVHQELRLSHYWSDTSDWARICSKQRVILWYTTRFNTEEYVIHILDHGRLCHGTGADSL